MVRARSYHRGTGGLDMIIRIQQHWVDDGGGSYYRGTGESSIIIRIKQLAGGE